MAYAALDRALDQRAGIDRIVPIIHQWITHRIRYYDRRREVDNRLDVAFADELRDQRLVARLADDEWYALGDRPPKAGREIIKHHDLLVGIDELVHHVAANIAGSAGDQDCHFFSRDPLS